MAEKKGNFLLKLSISSDELKKREKMENFCGKKETKICRQHTKITAPAAFLAQRGDIGLPPRALLGCDFDRPATQMTLVTAMTGRRQSGHPEMA